MSLDGDLSTVQLEKIGGDSYYQKKQESSCMVVTEQLTSSQSYISSNKLELSSEATSENKLEPVDNVKAFLFQGQNTKDDQAAFKISINKLELSSEAMSKMTLELVDSLNISLQFQGQSTEVEKEQRENITASPMRSNKQELCSEATSTSKKVDQKSFILQVRQEVMYPEGTENKIESRTDNDTNQLELV